MQKECTKSVLGNLLLTFFIVRPVLEAAGFCLFAPRYRSLGGFPTPQKWRKCIPISAALSNPLILVAAALARKSDMYTRI